MSSDVIRAGSVFVMALPLSRAKKKKKMICPAPETLSCCTVKLVTLMGKERPFSDKHVISSAQLWLHSRKSFNNGWLLVLVGRNKVQWIRCSFESSEHGSFLTLCLTSHQPPHYGFVTLTSSDLLPVSNAPTFLITHFENQLAAK